MSLGFETGPRRSPLETFAALNALARELAVAPDADHVGALAVRAAHELAGATRAWLWLRPAGAPEPGVVAVPLPGPQGPLGTLWAALPFPPGHPGRAEGEALLEAIAHQAARALEMLALRADLMAAEREAATDPLTGLWNRRHATLALEREVAIARRLGRPFAVLVVDLDRFKAINDTWGHGGGDAALAHVAGLLARGVRESDLVARWGGEEFLVLGPGTDASPALIVAERLRAAIAANPVAIAPGRLLPVTASIGAAAWQPEDADASAVVARADAAMYRAKAAGRDRVAI